VLPSSTPPHPPAPTPPPLQGALQARVVTMAGRCYAELCTNRLERAAGVSVFESVTCCSSKAGELKSGAAAVLDWAPGEVQGYRRGWHRLPLQASVTPPASLVRCCCPACLRVRRPVAACARGRSAAPARPAPQCP
jgi:hypothetical protein